MLPKAEWKPHSYKKGFFTFFFDEEPLYDVSALLFGKHPPLPQGKETLGQINEWFNDEVAKRARNFIYRKLSQKSYFSLELVALLVEQGVPETLANSLVAVCKEQGYIDDEAWVGSFVRSRIRRGEGQSLIIRKLMQKGVDAEEVAPFLEDEDSLERREEDISLLYEKNRRKYPDDPRKAQQKTLAAALRKGHSYEEVLSIVQF